MKLKSTVKSGALAINRNGRKVKVRAKVRAGVMPSDRRIKKKIRPLHEAI